MICFPCEVVRNAERFNQSVYEFSVLMMFAFFGFCFALLLLL